MGVNTRRPALLAPTESLTGNDSEAEQTDVATDVSRRTDRTSYSIPEDGSPLVLSTKKIKAEKLKGSSDESRTSLLIEYYESGRSNDKTDPRSSFRVKVTPHAKKS